jgi:hypothetical protein
MEDMQRNIPRILYSSLEDKQAEHQFHMLEVEGNIKNHPFSILIDLGERGNDIDTKSVEIFH